MNAHAFPYATNGAQLSFEPRTRTFYANSSNSTERNFRQRPYYIEATDSHIFEQKNIFYDQFDKSVEIVSRVYFTSGENVQNFVQQLDDYIIYNNIPSKNEYLVLKSSLKIEALLWLENIGRVLVKDDKTI